MIETPAQLYDIIKTTFSVIDTIICSIHKPCSSARLCKTPSSYSVLDFDGIEKTIAKKEKRKTLPSVDAITYTRGNRAFCFVELKGWQEFIKHSGIKNVDSPTEQEKLLVTQKAQSYDLKGKFDHSCNLCEVITNDTSVLSRLSVAYIIVTDIDSQKQAIDDFAANLTSLAGSSSIWTICDQEMQNNLKGVSTVVEKHYTHCNEFDDLMNKID